MPPKKKPLEDARKRLQEKLNNVEEQSEYICQFINDLVNKVICKCVVPENIHTPTTEGIGISRGVGGGGSRGPKNLKKCMKLNWNFQRGGALLEKIPSVGEVWIFSGTTQSLVDAV